MLGSYQLGSHCASPAHFPLSRSRSVQFTSSDPISLRFVPTLTSHLYPQFLSWCVSFRFPCQNPLHFPSPIYSTHPTQLIIFNLIVLKYFARRTTRQTVIYVTVSILLFLPPSLAQVSSATTCFRTVAYRGGVWGLKPPLNSEVLTKLNRIAN